VLESGELVKSIENELPVLGLEAVEVDVDVDVDVDGPST
jgi:hypothetical protein